MKYIKTNEEVQVENYPYGFKRTTLFDTMEFDFKKGYRHVTQTINPKNGALNKPKKSTYYPLLVRFYNEDNHIKSRAFSFNGDKDINKGLEFLNENFDLFTTEEKKYLYTLILSMLMVGMKASVIYSGAEFENLKPIYEPTINAMKEGMKNPLENFFNTQLDIEAINGCKVEGFNPFSVKSVVIDTE